MLLAAPTTGENSGKHRCYHYPLPNYNGLILNAPASELENASARGQKSLCAIDALGGILRMEQGPWIFKSIIV